jgi:hypothetical protein
MVVVPRVGAGRLCKQPLIGAPIASIVGPLTEDVAHHLPCHAINDFLSFAGNFPTEI